jgi:serine/threonine protein kinase
MNSNDLQIIQTCYTIEEELTKGDKIYKVYTATTEDDFNPVILKEMDEKRAQIYYALSKQWNPHIANVYSVHLLSNSTVLENGLTKQLYLAVTECVTNQNASTTLTDYIRNNGFLDEKSALLLCIQICDGLRELHKAGFIHKDLKPDNIMVSDKIDSYGLPLIKIIDFGVAERAEHLSDETIIKSIIEDAGTDGYSPHDKKVTPRWDVYSIGCILNFMLTGHTPDMDIYRSSWSVRRIIEHATDDFSARYGSVTLLSRALAHEARLGCTDKIPILRSIPGYRSHTLWKELVATIYYLSLIYLVSYNFLTKNYNWDTLNTIFFWYILPIIIVFDPFNWLIRIKGVRTLRKNTYTNIIVKVILVILCFFIPIIISNLIN